MPVVAWFNIGVSDRRDVIADASIGGRHRAILKLLIDCVAEVVVKVLVDRTVMLPPTAVKKAPKYFCSDVDP